MICVYLFCHRPQLNARLSCFELDSVLFNGISNRLIHIRNELYRNGCPTGYSLINRQLLVRKLRGTYQRGLKLIVKFGRAVAHPLQEAVF
jgi:hypothetical protein